LEEVFIALIETTSQQQYIALLEDPCSSGENVVLSYELDAEVIREYRRDGKLIVEIDMGGDVYWHGRDFESEENIGQYMLHRHCLERNWQEHNCLTEYFAIIDRNPRLTFNSWEDAVDWMRNDESTRRDSG
jgi:hypothetical protein